MTLKSAIQYWDTKEADGIEAVYDEFSNEVGFAQRLIEFLADIDLQRGSTWLIKKYLEQNGELLEKQVSALLSELSNMQHWESQLHILQCLPFLIIPEKESENLHNFLLTAIKSERKFVRAWSYGGLIELCEQYFEFRDRDRKIIEKAYKNESGSICARIRQAASKRPFWIDILK